MNVAVLGASNKPQRYSHQAIMLLLARGHTPFPVHPVIGMIGDLLVYPSLDRISDPIDTITVYLSAANSDQHGQGMIESGARRVIFNPGAENPILAERVRAAGIEVLEACTLVLLKMNRF